LGLQRHNKADIKLEKDDMIDQYKPLWTIDGSSDSDDMLEFGGAKWGDVNLQHPDSDAFLGEYGDREHSAKSRSAATSRILLGWQEPETMFFEPASPHPRQQLAKGSQCPEPSCLGRLMRRTPKVLANGHLLDENVVFAARSCCQFAGVGDRARPLKKLHERVAASQRAFWQMRQKRE
jgi:hypothetical protein